jgi:hypothetical protein
MERLDSVEIIGAALICNFHPSFAIAIGKHPARPGYWAQILNPSSQKIIGFAPLSEDYFEDINFVEANIQISTGDIYIHAFLDKSGSLYLDTAKNLQVLFGVALNDPATASPVKLSISENMDKIYRVRQFRSGVADAVAVSFGGYAGQSLSNSTARSSLWDLLEAAAVDDHARRRIQNVRSRLLARISNDGSVDVDLTFLNPEDINVTVEEIVSRLQGNLGRRRGGLEMPRVDLSRLPSSADPTIITILDAVKRSPRQEERIAILIRSLILHPLPALRAMEIYKDSAQMAQSGVAMLRDRFAHGSENLNEYWLVSQLVPIIRRLISGAYPRRRGVMLFYFAEHLSDFPPIAGVLRQVLDGTSARDVEELRPIILKALDGKNTISNF